jgi:hypothetical protein
MSGHSPIGAVIPHQVHKTVTGLVTGSDQFVQFEVQGFGISVLGMLDQEDH